MVQPHMGHTKTSPPHKRGVGAFYRSDSLDASAETADQVKVHVHIPLSVPLLGDMTKDAVALLQKSLSDEFEALILSYRVMLRESLAKGDDPKVKAALNRARLQEKILNATSMVSQAQACELLGLSPANPSATMKRREEKGELLRFSVDGKPVYPLFQFDVNGRRIYPVMARLIELTPEGWSDFRLLYWLMQAHLDLGAPPSDHLGDMPDEVVAAFAREIEPVVHG